MLHRSSKATLSLRTILGLGVLFVVCMGALIFHGALFRFTSSLAVMFSASPSEEYLLLPKQVLASRLVAAEEELARVRYQALLYAELMEENARLASALDLRSRDTLATARVIAHPPRTHYDTLLIEYADDVTLAVGDQALVGDILLGAVTEVGDHTALVSLFSSANESVDARIGEPSGIVTLRGQGGGAFIFEVPTDLEVNEGDVVVSAYDSTKGIAVVSGVAIDPDRTAKVVYARLPLSFPDIRFVSIERPSVAP